MRSNITGMVLSLLIAFFAIQAVKLSLNYLIASQQVSRIDDLPTFNVHQDYSPKEFQALIRIETSGKHSEFQCSGTVISDDYVLTAAHCLTNGRGGLTSDKFRIISLPNKNSEALEVEGTPATFNTRADYALIKGDFSRFSKLPLDLGLDVGIMHFGDNVLLNCGFPWGQANGICYQMLTHPVMEDFAFKAKGRLYPGMSGGPVIDSKTGLIVAVNYAVNGEYILVSPIIALFDNLHVKVVQ